MCESEEAEGDDRPGCAIAIGGCFGDQPLLGADDNGIYITTNEFGVAISNLTFNGAQIYAISKAGLESLFGERVYRPLAGRMYLALIPPRL